MENVPKLPDIARRPENKRLFREPTKIINELNSLNLNYQYKYIELQPLCNDNPIYSDIFPEYLVPRHQKISISKQNLISGKQVIIH